MCIRDRLPDVQASTLFGLLNFTSTRTKTASILESTVFINRYSFFFLNAVFLWNSLPPHLLNCTSLHPFKRLYIKGEHIHIGTLLCNPIFIKTWNWHVWDKNSLSLSHHLLASGSKCSIFAWVRFQSILRVAPLLLSNCGVWLARLSYIVKLLTRRSLARCLWLKAFKYKCRSVMADVSEV